MFKYIGETSDEIQQVLEAFSSAGTAKDVFSSVVQSYTSYLSDMFWKEILEAIDWDLVTTIITDILGPIFEGIGNIFAAMITAAPLGTIIGGGIGGLIGSFFGHPVIGAIIGAALGALIESFIGWLNPANWGPQPPPGGGPPPGGSPCGHWRMVTFPLPHFEWVDIPCPEMPTGGVGDTYVGERFPIISHRFDRGGIPQRAITGTVEPHEAIIPLDTLYFKFDEFATLLTEIRDYQRKIWLEKEYRHR